MPSGSGSAMAVHAVAAVVYKLLNGQLNALPGLYIEISAKVSYGESHECTFIASVGCFRWTAIMALIARVTSCV